jgi:hypothetical protein
MLEKKGRQGKKAPNIINNAMTDSKSSDIKSSSLCVEGNRDWKKFSITFITE